MLRHSKHFLQSLDFLLTNIVQIYLELLEGVMLNMLDLANFN